MARPFPPCEDCGRRALTKADLERALGDERRQGTLGYYERDICGANQRLRSKGDSLLIRTANAKGFTYDDLVVWVDSKFGRWFWDSLYGCDDPEGAARLVHLDWLAPGEGDYVYTSTPYAVAVARATTR